MAIPLILPAAATAAKLAAPWLVNAGIGAGSVAAVGNLAGQVDGVREFFRN